MSTRCNIHFARNHYVVANVYRNAYNGDHGVLRDIQRFFAAVEEQCESRERFNDAEGLAAKFIVWQALELAGGHERATATPLRFSGVTPCIRDHHDIEHVFVIDCDSLDKDGRPSVRAR